MKSVEKKVHLKTSTKDNAQMTQSDKKDGAPTFVEGVISEVVAGRAPPTCVVDARRELYKLFAGRGVCSAIRACFEYKAAIKKKAK